MKLRTTYDRSTNGVEVQIASSRLQVWVNTPNCIARFGPYSFEVVAEPMVFVPVHKGVGPEHWRIFRQKLLDIHGVFVPDLHRPEPLREEAQIT